VLYTFYGDDFTGSTDVLEQLASNGVATVLFLGTPSAEHLAKFPGVEAIGIAGDSRSRSPEWMTANLPGLFETLKAFRAPINHYKVCSTFDSSPTCGSIGRAMEIGREVFQLRFIPIVVGAPHLRRYVAFGNLFAAAPGGQIERIDRHPMASHPVTPMREADLRHHLHAQTEMPIELMDLTMLQTGQLLEHRKYIDRQLADGFQAILFDGIDYQTLAATGELLWSNARQRPIFSASSSGLTAALILAWRKANLIPAMLPVALCAQRDAPLFVVSGSCSPVTAGQIRWALANGFHGISLDPEKVLDPEYGAGLVAEAATSLGAGQNTILYTALGPPDAPAQGDALGVALGHFLRQVVQQTGVSRILLCGGDTSSHAIQQLGLYALTWASCVQTGAPLCRAHSDDPALQNLELVLKGGQIGTADFFRAVAQA
jgi:uncharacterized protein YgbK (DUF1537 family)